jgi:hypothetical protein
VQKTAAVCQLFVAFVPSLCRQFDRLYIVMKTESETENNKKKAVFPTGVSNALRRMYFSARKRISVLFSPML